ncbi:AcvB/VirJ family lysyl-phosphatidylglycerol hydrolase [Sphingomonas sp. 4RDLI-65]|uniref:AcvB/VirJ family lysyl-phosphatidylglycerol hydrolase n=1 Tax=Sphingomonas sp. 4RDLI-65 TaxID=3111641 RepID=UPI003C244DAE
MRGFRVILVGFAVVVFGAAGAMAWLGYFGGPLFTDVPTTGPRQRVAAVFLSSDMGLRSGMAPEVMRRLAADGVSVVGVNTLTYMRKARTPAEVTALVARAEVRALRLGDTDRVVLIGQSFGADMLHVGLFGLPPSLRAKIAGIVLVVPEDTVEFRASPGEILDAWTPTTDALPTARALTWAPVLCVSGIEEPASLCPLLTQPNVRRVALPGGHPLHRDVDALYATVSRFVFAH